MVNRLLRRTLETLMRGQFGGVSIGFIFFVILILSTLGVVTYSVTTIDTRLSLNYLNAAQAQFLAEAGVEYGIKRVLDGESPPYSESVTVNNGSFSISLVDQDSLLQLTSTGTIEASKKVIEIIFTNQRSVADFGIFSTGEVTNVTSLDVNGDPDPSLLLENAPSMPAIDDSALIDLATSQGHVESGPEFSPAHGYPNFNFYHSGTTPNVTYVQGDLKVKGGRTVYGIFFVEGNIFLEGSSRVEGVLYMVTNTTIVIHGGGSPTQSSVTGGIVANGNVDGTGNHITVQYNPEYMEKFGDYEHLTGSRQILSWREL